MPVSDQPPLDEGPIRRAFDAWNARDVEGWLADVHPDGEYQPGIVVGRPEGERVVYRGHEELRGFFDEWHSTWQTQIVLDTIEQVGELVLILGTMRMTGSQSGASAEQEVGFIARIEDDKLRRIESYPTQEAARAAAV
jgi:ketosteroid isomerase-like protein